MAARRIIVGDQEVEIPEFNFKITPVLIGILVIWLLTGIYVVGPDEVGVVRTFGEFTRVTPVSYTHLTLPTTRHV